MCVMFYFYNFLLRSAAQLRPPCHARPNDAEKWKSGKKQQKQLQQTTTATTTTALAVKVFQFFFSSLHLHASVCVYLFRFEIRVYLYLWEFFFVRLPFSLFATRIGTSGGRSASSSAFALAQITAHNFHITSAHLECVESLSVCLCVCVYVCTYPTIASCCRCLAPLASGIRNIAIWKSILLMIAMWHTLAHSDTHTHTYTHIYASYADLLITSHSPQVTPLNL